MFFALHLLPSKASLWKNKIHCFVMCMSKVSQDHYRIDLCGGGGGGDRSSGKKEM
jgi:hypothetical protein